MQGKKLSWALAAGIAVFCFFAFYTFVGYFDELRKPEAARPEYGSAGQIVSFGLMASFFLGLAAYAFVFTLTKLAQWLRARMSTE